LAIDILIAIVGGELVGTFFAGAPWNSINAYM
jgi:hypothetical protein